MKLETFRATPLIKQKFVLVRVSQSNKEHLLLWGNPDIEWHMQIIEEITNAGHEIKDILGGGWLLSKPEDRVVYIWGKSDRLGLAPIELVREVLGDSVVESEPE
ncbi:MAG: hypothetical protein AB203_00805 [Parcubacteria bacterium C7867-008]|nr:MAG: hypothetical protein AB203_00805 [Parcubacteria bacterium C7867-008]